MIDCSFGVANVGYILIMLSQTLFNANFKYICSFLS